jgi:hypothetical protein
MRSSLPLRSALLAGCLSGNHPATRHRIAILAGTATGTGKPINYLYLSFFLESLA